MNQSTMQANVSQENAYPLLNEALAALPGNADAVHQAVLALVRLGLYGPARELITDARWGLLNRPEYSALLPQLARAPSGRVSWASLQSRFERNLQRLLPGRAELAEFESAWREIPRRAELYRTLDGSHHLLTRGDDGIPRGYGPLLDLQPVIGRMTLPHGEHAHTCAPYAICNDRFGALHSRVFRATSKMLHSFSPRLYVIERDPCSLGAALYLCEDVEMFCHDRVALFIGPACAENFLAAMAAHTCRELPLHVLGLPADGDLQSVVLQGLRDLAAKRGQTARVHLLEAKEWYDSRPAGHWAERFSRTRREPLRVVGLTSRFTTVLQFVMRDLKAAFERRGHSFHTFIEPNDHDTLTPLEVVKTINDFRPDLAIAIDHTRAGQSGLLPTGLPYVGWLQDLLPHLMTTRAGESIGPLEFFIAPELNQFVNTYHYPAERGMVWTLATDAELYSAARMPDEALAPHRCDVSYVSNQSQPPEAFVAAYCAQSINSEHGRALCHWLFERIREQVEQGGAPRSATLLLREAIDARGIAPTDPTAADTFARTFIHPLSELIFRQTALQWVADYCASRGKTLRLYGQGWESHPRLGSFACGVAANGPMLRAVYQASTINLQVIGSGAVHQRLLDGLAAGGFFLIRDCPLDRLHQPVSRVLAEVSRLGIETGRAYPTAELPVLANALAEARHLRGLADAPSHEDRNHELTEGDASTAGLCIKQEELNFYHELDATGFRRVAGAVFADYPHVCFTHREHLFEKLDRFFADEPQRRALANRMRQIVLERFTYDGLVDALLTFLADRIQAA